MQACRAVAHCALVGLLVTYLFRLASSGNLLGGFNNSAATVLQRLLQRLEPTVILGCCSGLEACDTFGLVILSFGAAVWGIALGLPLRGSRP